jgi:hypothetical protein
MLLVRLLWIATSLLALAGDVFYVIDSNTTMWYVGIAAALPLVILITLRVLAIEKRQDEPTRFISGDLQGPLGPPERLIFPRLVVMARPSPCQRPDRHRPSEGLPCVRVRLARVGALLSQS